MIDRQPEPTRFEIACRAFEAEMWPNGPAHGSGSGIWAKHKPAIEAEARASLDVDVLARAEHEYDRAGWLDAGPAYDDGTTRAKWVAREYRAILAETERRG